LSEPLDRIPEGMEEWDLRLEDDGHQLCYAFDSNAERTGIASVMKRLGDLGIGYKDLSTRQSSLEDIFVQLVHAPGKAA
jgi:ABC-2 type transport system ATP-binding protein